MSRLNSREVRLLKQFENKPFLYDNTLTVYKNCKLKSRLRSSSLFSKKLIAEEFLEDVEVYFFDKIEKSWYRSKTGDSYSVFFIESILKDGKLKNGSEYFEALILSLDQLKLIIPKN